MKRKCFLIFHTFILLVLFLIYNYQSTIDHLTYQHKLALQPLTSETNQEKLLPPPSNTNRTLVPDCSNWSQVIDLRDHPCGEPGAGTPDLESINIRPDEPVRRKQYFDQIYDKSFWWSRESKSGLASEKKAAGDIKRILSQVINFIKTKLGKETISILDSSCGDMNWLPGRLIFGIKLIFFLPLVGYFCLFPIILINAMK